MSMVKVKATRLQALGVAVRLLGDAAVDLDDPSETEAYYSSANLLMAAIIAARARNFEEAQVKAEAVAWCCASRTDFGLDDAASNRVLHSLLLDLLTEVSEASERRTD